MDRAQEIAELKRRLAALEEEQAASTVSEPPGSGLSAAEASNAPRPQVSQTGSVLPAEGNNAIVFILVISAVVVFVALIPALFSKSSTKTNQPTPPENALVADAEATAAAPEPPAPVTAWRYSASTDPMTDKTTYSACVESSDNVQLGWPYGPVSAELCLRNSPRFGKDVYVHLLGDGQMLCRSYEECTVRIRFDKASPQSFSALGPSDGSTNMVFLQNISRAVEGLKNASRTIVQAEFYQAGVQEMTFDTSGLDLVQAGFASARSQKRTEPSTRVPTQKPKVYGPTERPSSPPTASPTSAPSGSAQITSPDWSRMPNSEDLARFYPDRAQRAEVEGRATVECTVTASGTLIGCSVLSEEPADYGFGDATLRASKYFKMRPQTKDGSPVTGGIVRIPLVWKLPR